MLLASSQSKIINGITVLCSLPQQYVISRVDVLSFITLLHTVHFLCSCVMSFCLIRSYTKVHRRERERERTDEKLLSGKIH